MAAATPLIEPNRPLLITAILAGPPYPRPASRQARSVKNWPVLVFSRKAPKMTKRATKVADTPVMEPNRPASVIRYCISTSSSRVIGLEKKTPGRYGAT